MNKASTESKPGAENKMHVLLVEDNPADSTLLEELLEEGSYQVALYCTNDGFDAFNFLHQRERYQAVPKPDVILLDLGLPRMNGYEVLERVCKTQSFSHIPVIVFTTSRDPKDRELCLALGAYDFVSKPYNLEGYETLIDRLANEVLPKLSKLSRAAMH